MTITVKLESTAEIRRRCMFCDGETPKTAANAVVYEDGERTNYVVCSDCLAAENVAGTIRDTAATYRKHAAALDALAAHVPALPSLADWQAANPGLMTYAEHCLMGSADAGVH